METKKINGLTVLSASEGMMLRNGDSFSETVVLGRYDKAENYTEVSRDEYEAYVREHAAEHVGEGSSPGTEETPEPPHLVPTLSDAIAGKVAEINAYDTSTAVNGFKLNGNVFWLDKATRVGLMNSTEITKAAGQETTDLWMDDVKLTIPCDTVIKLLSAIELYALECFNTTARHKAEVRKLKTVEEVEKYDIKEGYPKQLEINLDGLDR
jgi:hypothetical protein